MATKTYPNILKYGLQASYDALGVKDSNVLYFCTDTKKTISTLLIVSFLLLQNPLLVLLLVSFM